MKTGVLNILKGTFLISGDAPKNWLFIIFTSFLATVMIGSSHSADKKVHQIAALNEEVKELRSEFVDVRSDMQQLKLESTVLQIVAGKGLYPSEVPPKQIKVLSQSGRSPQGGTKSSEIEKQKNEVVIQNKYTPKSKLIPKSKTNAY